MAQSHLLTGPRIAGGEAGANPPSPSASRYVAAGPGQIRLLARRSVLHAGLRRGVDVLRRQKDHRLHPGRSCRGDGRADGGGTNVVGQVHDDVEVIPTEPEVERLERPADRACECFDGLDTAGAALLPDPLDPLYAVTAVPE